MWRFRHYFTFHCYLVGVAVTRQSEAHTATVTPTLVSQLLIYAKRIAYAARYPMLYIIYIRKLKYQGEDIYVY